MDDLIRFVATRSDSDLTRNVLDGVLSALRVHERRVTAPTIPMGTFSPQRRWTFTPGRLSVPLDALVFAVEHGRTAHARSSALWTMTQLLPDSEVHAYLLPWAQARRGPPEFPLLPEELAGKIYRLKDERTAAFRAALEADISLVLNPMARCWVDRRGMPSEGPDTARRCGGGY